MTRGLAFGIAVCSSIVLASSLQVAAEDNDLFGHRNVKGISQAGLGSSELNSLPNPSEVICFRRCVFGATP